MLLRRVVQEVELVSDVKTYHSQQKVVPPESGEKVRLGVSRTTLFLQMARACSTRI